MAKIKEGYYWVKIDNEWTPAEYDGDMWYIILGKWALKTEELQEIGEKLERKGNTDNSENANCAIFDVSNLLLDELWIDRWITKLEAKLKLEHRAQQAIQIERELNILRTIKKKAVTPKSNNC